MITVPLGPLARRRSVTIHGCAVPYGSWSEVVDDGAGPMRERFERGAFKGASFANVRLLLDHAEHRVLASVARRTMALWENSAGLYFEAVVHGDSDLLRAVAERRHASIGFRREPAHETAFAGMGDCVDRRSIARAGLREVSLVLRPAYPGAMVRAGSILATVRH